ncbi:MAG: hypothetical protein ACXW23_18020 [Telluria sp.]
MSQKIDSLSQNELLKQLLRCLDLIERGTADATMHRGLINQARTLAFNLAEISGRPASNENIRSADANDYSQLTEVAKTIRIGAAADVNGLSFSRYDFNDTVKSFGWHDPEVNDSGHHRRWCGGQPIASIGVPDKQRTLEMLGLYSCVYTAEQMQPGVISFSVNNRPKAVSRVVQEDGGVYFWIPVDGEELIKEITVRSSKVFSPSDHSECDDQRKLGLCVFDIIEVHRTETSALLD